MIYKKCRSGRDFVVILTCCLILFTSFSCRFGPPFVATPITSNTVIDSEEKVFIFEKPFKPYKPINKVCFEYPDKLDATVISEPPKFPDGESLNITAYVFDQNGKRYELDYIENSVENYLCLRPDYDGWLKISDKDVSFIKLTVKSNRRIRMSKIQWVSYHILDI